MITISLCMIVKNESAILNRCLDSICDLVDEIIIVDTGSTDNTKDVASKYTDKIFDYSWADNFADARNFAFSKASMDYIYSADADEVLDEINRKQFRQLKEVLLPEIEIVQMKYVTKTDFNTVLNAKKEYRAKLYKRLRSFTWIDPIHETVRTAPVVFDSDIEIFHMPVSMHHKRDFSIFLKAYQKDGQLSKKVRSMYAKELFISGTDEDFINSKPVFLDFINSPAANDPDQADAVKEASCVLMHISRIKEDFANFLKLTLNDMLTNPCAESCVEIGEYFYETGNYDTAIMWFYNAAFETESVIYARSSGDIPLKRLSDCYNALTAQLQDELFLSNTSFSIEEQLTEYKNMAASYLAQSKAWKLPEEL